jgi:hypothetical protein
MAELPDMTAAELMATREFLGLSKAWLAECTTVDERRIRRMELGQEETIPAKIPKLLDEVYDDTTRTVKQLVEKYRLLAKTREVIEYPVYRNDDEYRKAHPHSRYPAGWHRMVAMRVADAVPEVALVFKEPFRVDRPPWAQNGGRRRVPKVQEVGKGGGQPVSSRA